MLVFSSNKENSAPFIREVTTDFFGKLSDDIGIYTLSPVLSNYQSLHWILPNVPSDDGMSMTYYTTQTGPYLYHHISTHIPAILSSENENSVPVYTNYDSDLQESEIKRSQISFISDDIIKATFEGYSIVTLPDGTGANTVVLVFTSDTEFVDMEYMIISNGEEPCVISILTDYLVMAGLIPVYTYPNRHVGHIDIQYSQEAGYCILLHISPTAQVKEFYMVLPKVTIEE